MHRPTTVWHIHNNALSALLQHSKLAIVCCSTHGARSCLIPILWGLNVLVLLSPCMKPEHSSLPLHAWCSLVPHPRTMCIECSGSALKLMHETVALHVWPEPLLLPEASNARFSRILDLCAWHDAAPVGSWQPACSRTV